MSIDKPRYTYESAYGGKREVELFLSAYTHSDNLYVGLKAVDPDGSTYHYADLTVNIPSAAPLEPFRSAIDIEHLGQLDAMNFLSENGLADHTGKTLPSGHMAFPVYEFDAEKLAKADPQGFRDYLKIVGLDEQQIESNAVEDLAAMAKERFLEKTAGEEPQEPLGDSPRENPFDEIPDALEGDEERFAEPASPGMGLIGFDLEAFMRYCEDEGLEPDQVEPREDADSLEEAKRQVKERASEKNAGRSERDPSKPSPDMER